MKDEKLEQLMSSYRDSMGHARRPVAPARSRLPRLALSGAMGAVLVAAVILWPRDATAAAFDRVKQAITNAKTMRMDFEMDGHRGFQTFCTTYYKDGAWRYESRQGTMLEGIYIERDGKLISSYKNLGHSTIQPFDPETMSAYPAREMDALEFAKQSVDMGTIGEERSMKLLPGRDNSTYILRLERPSNNYVAEILVDRKTDLPISTDVTVAVNVGGLSTKAQRYRQMFRFNEPLADSFFEAPAGKPLVNITAEQSRLAKQWKKPIARIETTDIRDARITQDGTLWLLVTPVDPPKIDETRYDPEARKTQVQMLPSEIDAGNGMTYVRAREMVVASILGPRPRMKLEGKSIFIVPFTPLHRTSELPGKVTVRMATRLAGYPGSSGPEDEIESREAGETATVSVIQDLAALPSYFTALDNDHFGFHVPITLAEAKADYFEEAEDWENAGRAHEECARAYDGFVKYAAFRPLDKAAECYRKAGMAADAERVREASRILKESRVR
jgi:hypothetical protein